MFKKNNTKISYSELTGNNKEEKKSCFLPCLHLDNQHKISLEQEKHFSEIYLWLYEKNKKSSQISQADDLIKKEKLKTNENNPVGNL